MIIAKYKFDKSIYENLIPTFNDGYTGYTISDEIDSTNSNHIIRTIECDVLPTLMRFGSNAEQDADYQSDNRVESLLEINALNTDNLTSCERMFKFCKNLKKVSCDINTRNVTTLHDIFANCYSLTTIDVSKWDTSKVTNMAGMFYNCKLLTSLDVSNFDTSKVTNMNSMFYKCQSLTSLDVSNWDTSNVTSMHSMFRDCTNLTSIDVSNWDTSNVTIMQAMFYKCYNLTSLDVRKWDTSKVNDMIGTFTGCQSLTSLDVSNWDTSQVTYMGNMFDNCKSLTSIDVSNWETGNVTGMYAMFSDCANISSLELTNWNVSKVTDIQYFLDGLSFSSVNIKHLDLSFLELSSVTHMGGMFYKNKATDIKLPKVINPNLTSVVKIYDDGQTPKGMFYCSNLVSLDFGGLDISNVTDDKSLILEHVPKLRYIRTENAALIADLAQYFPARTEAEQGYLITKASVSDEIRTLLAGKYWNVVDLDEVGTDIAIYKFDKSIYKSLVPGFDNNFADWFIDDVVEDEVNAPNIVTRTIRSMGGLPTSIHLGGQHLGNYIYTTYQNCLLSIDYLKIDSNITTLGGLCYHCKNLTHINTEGWDTSNVTLMNTIFEGCRSLTSIDVSNWDTSNVTTMFSMFGDCRELVTIGDVSDWDTSKVTNMNYMFYNCNKLTSLDVSNWDTGNVTNMAGMFYNCKLLTSLDVSDWDTSKVTNMNYMFYNCKLLTSLDVSKWDTSNVTNMNSMFNATDGALMNLMSLDVSNWNTGKVTDMYNLFGDCQKLQALDVSKWDTSNVTNMSQLFHNCQALTSLDVSKWDTSNVTDMNNMFRGCANLTSLDVSNFNTSNVTNMIDMIYNDNILSNIGMIYCDFKTVEKIASLVPTTNPTTIWVGNHIDFNALPQYDHITYKMYEVEDKLEVELSSPLLEGDRLEIIDGNLYHYHNAESVTYNGKSCLWSYGTTDCGWIQNGDYYGFYNYYLNPYESITSKNISEILYVDNFINGGHLLVGRSDINAFGRDKLGKIIDNNFIVNDFITYFIIRLHKDELKEISNNGINQWLQANPTTIVYKLANPYYELVKPNVGLLNAEQGFYLNISDSVVPVVNHQDLCTLKLNYLLPNVEYKVKFKANNPGSIAINLGGTLVPLDVVEGWNEVMVTTPETLVDEYLKVNGSEGIKIQNVMVIDSNKDFDYFKGINNTFDEIPVKNICKNRTLTYTHGVDEEGVSPQGEMNVNVSKGKVVTVVGKVSINPNNLPLSINLYNDTGRATGKNLWAYGDSIVTGYFETPLSDTPILKAGYYRFTSETKKYGQEESYPQIAFFSKNDGYIDRFIAIHTDIFLPSDVYRIRLYSYGYNHNASISRPVDFKNIQISESLERIPYEPFRNYVNDEPVYIDYTTALADEGEVDVSTTDGYFAITIRADRDYANRIGFNVGDASSCEANDQVTITDLMVFEGDILDCHPTTYVDPADTRYLVEYKSIGNPFGFGKNKLI